jgi:hypothetical protein
MPLVAWLVVFWGMTGCLSGVHSDPNCHADTPHIAGDGCCPPGATTESDSDCIIVCGDNKCNGAESCYTCPIDCKDCPESIWKEVATPTENNLNAIWGTSQDDVWVVGQRGVILRWNGTEWANIDSPTMYDLHDVWAIDTDDAWAVGDEGTLLRWNGSVWTLIPDVASSGDYDGDPDDLVSVHGTSAEDVWVLVKYYEDMILHFNGVSWKSYPNSHEKAGKQVFSVSKTDAWILDDNLYRWNGISWSSATMTLSNEINFGGIWGNSSDDVWAVGSDYLNIFSGGLVFHFTGQEWEEAPRLPYPASSPQAVWGDGQSLWALNNDGVINRLDGESWTCEQPTMYLMLFFNDIWGTSADNIWAVGDKGIILHRAGE